MKKNPKNRNLDAIGILYLLVFMERKYRLMLAYTRCYVVFR